MSELREKIARAIAPHLRGMTSANPDNETQHRNREYALGVADGVLDALRAEGALIVKASEAQFKEWVDNCHWCGGSGRMRSAGSYEQDVECENCAPLHAAFATNTGKE